MDKRFSNVTPRDTIFPPITTVNGARRTRAGPVLSGIHFFVAIHEQQRCCDRNWLKYISRYRRPYRHISHYRDPKASCNVA